MATYSDMLDLLYQETNENPNTWGDILNDQQKLLESAFVTADVNVQSVTTFTLDNARGSENGTEHYRNCILDINGTPSGACDVILPDGITSTVPLKKFWIAANNTSGGQIITFRTSAGSGITIPAGEAVLCYCDGTDIVGTYVENANTANSATTATTATTATNATQLGGVAAANYAQTATLLSTRNTWTAGQVVERAAPLTGATITPNLSTSNSFYHLTTQNFTLAAPTNAVDGDTFGLVIQQGAPGNHTITFATNTYIFENGSAPTLSTTAGNVDVMTFEYCADIATGGGGQPNGQWIGTIMRNVS